MISLLNYAELATPLHAMFNNQPQFRPYLTNITPSWIAMPARQLRLTKRPEKYEAINALTPVRHPTIRRDLKPASDCLVRFVGEIDSVLRHRSTGRASDQISTATSQ